MTVDDRLRGGGGGGVAVRRLRCARRRWWAALVLAVMAAVVAAAVLVAGGVDLWDGGDGGPLWRGDLGLTLMGAGVLLFVVGSVWAARAGALWGRRRSAWRRLDREERRQVTALVVQGEAAPKALENAALACARMLLAHGELMLSYVGALVVLVGFALLALSPALVVSASILVLLALAAVLFGCGLARRARRWMVTFAPDSTT